jgi:hypothetical protein
MTTTPGTASLWLSEKHSFEESSLSGYFDRFASQSRIKSGRTTTETTKIASPVSVG